MEALKQQLQELWEMRIPSELLSIIESYLAIYLIGYDEDNKCEQEYEVDFEALVKYSGFARNAVVYDENWIKFKVKSGRPGTDVLAPHTTVKYMADWINHYSRSHIEPPIIKKPVRAFNLPSLIKYTFKGSSLSEEVKEREGKWWGEFIASMEESNGIFLDVLYATNYMDMTATKEYGGLMDMIAARFAIPYRMTPTRYIDRYINMLVEQYQSNYWWDIHIFQYPLKRAN